MAPYRGLDARNDDEEAAVPAFTKSCSVDYISRELVTGAQKTMKKRAAIAVSLVGAVAVGYATFGHVAGRQAKVSSPAHRTVLSEEHSGGAAAASSIEITLDATSEAQLMDGIILPGNDLESHKDVTDEQACSALCKQNSDCYAWSWGKPNGLANSRRCFLKGTTPRDMTKVSSVGFVSGVVAKEGGETLSLVTREVGQSLYCYSLVQPEGYEAGLLKMQYDESASIFACDEYGLYSNKHIDIAPGVEVSIVNSTLKCELGGEFRTALNTGIFLAVWSKVVTDGRFVDHDWTAKVDPDAVFFPSRLRDHLMNHLEEEGGVYINNCKYGMHGPLEVFSRNAIKAWALGAGECVEYFTELCSGMCGWGEDMFIDQCLDRKLKVRRDNDYSMLLEDHCDPPPNWDDCTATSAVAFHPFKTEAGWVGCYRKTKQQQEKQDSEAVDRLL